MRVPGWLGRVFPAVRALSVRQTTARRRYGCHQSQSRAEALEVRSLLSAAPLTSADQISVNTHLGGDQTVPSVAMDANGDYVVTWQSYRQDGSFNGIYARRYDATGHPLSDEFQVNTYTTSDQGYPSIPMDSAGDFVIT